MVKDDSGQAIADEAGLKTLVLEGYNQVVEAVGTGDAQAALLDEPVGVFTRRSSATTARSWPWAIPSQAG